MTADPMSSLPKATYTVSPNPPAPIKAAITTIDKDNINVWFIPAIIVLSAKGISIFIKINNLVKPKLDPASLKPFPTCLIPKFVSLIVGGKAKIIVAITPGVRPIPKSITTGIKYTKLGMVCITSNIGLMIISNTLLLEQRIPRGIPIIIQNITAVKIIAKVVILSDQRSTRSIKTNPTIVKIENFKPFVLYAKYTNIKTAIGNGIML